MSHLSEDDSSTSESTRVTSYVGNKFNNNEKTTTHKGIRKMQVDMSNSSNNSSLMFDNSLFKSSIEEVGICTRPRYFTCIGGFTLHGYYQNFNSILTKLELKTQNKRKVSEAVMFKSNL